MTKWFEPGEDEERAIKAFMAQVTSLPLTTPMRDAMPLWWRAQVVKRWDAERHAQAPLEIMERVEIVAGIAAATVLLVWAVPTVARIVVAPFLALLG
jgi:hypothetical protein